MKALVKYGQEPGMVELRDVEKPSVRVGAVLLKVKAAGICGWDIEMWKHTMANPVTIPVTQGHEFSGEVMELGDGVTGWNIGDRVAAETSAHVCGKCYLCLSGDYQLCPERKGFGYGVDGAFAEYVVVRQEILHAIPRGISYEEAALTEPFCVTHHALTDQIEVRKDDTVLVIGPGPVGLITLQMAKVLGAKRTILAGTSSNSARMKIAAENGWADVTIDIGKEDPMQVVAEVTGGRGADVVADCAGGTSSLNMALECVRRKGSIVKIGWGPKPFNQSLDILLRKSAILAGTFGHNRKDWNAVIGMFADGRLHPKQLISSVLPLTDWHKAFEMIEAKQAIKIVLVP